MKIKEKTRDNNFDQPPRSLEKIADANTVIGESIKTFKISEGFKIAGGNGTVITVKPKGFLVDDGKGCRLLKMDDSAIDTLIEKTGDLVHNITENV